MDKEYSLQCAQILLHTGAVTINTTEWFVYTSGIKSPIYCDLRWLISFPSERQSIVQYLVQALELERQGDIDVVAGVATSGIPYASWVADRIDKPMVYVRESSKAHGKGRQIEGKLERNQHVLVVEDLITTGGSAIRTANALRNEGARVTHCLGIFEYGLEDAQRAFKDAELSTITLCSLTDLLLCAHNAGTISEQDRAVVERWLLG